MSSQQKYLRYCNMQAVNVHLSRRCKRWVLSETRFFLTSIWLFIKFSCAFCSEFSRLLVLGPEPMAPCALKGKVAKPSLEFWIWSSWSFCDWLELLASDCGVLDVDWGPDLMIEYGILISMVYERTNHPLQCYQFNTVTIRFDSVITKYIKVDKRRQTPI